MTSAILSRRTAAVVAALVLPFAAVPAASATDEQATAPYAAQQQAYLASLERAASRTGAADPAGTSAYAAQQQAYTQHLAHTAHAAQGQVTQAGEAERAAGQAPAISAGDPDGAVTTPVAGLLAVAVIALGTGAAVVARRLPTGHGQRLAG